MVEFAAEWVESNVGECSAWYERYLSNTGFTGTLRIRGPGPRRLPQSLHSLRVPFVLPGSPLHLSFNWLFQSKCGSYFAHRPRIHRYGAGGPKYLLGWAWKALWQAADVWICIREFCVWYVHQTLSSTLERFQSMPVAWNSAFDRLLTHIHMRWLAESVDPSTKVKNDPIKTPVTEPRCMVRATDGASGKKKIKISTIVCIGSLNASFETIFFNRFPNPCLPFSTLDRSCWCTTIQ